MNRSGMGFVYHFGNEEWVAARTETQIFPIFANTPQPDGSLLPDFADVPQYSEKSLRQSYVQVWQDGKMLYSYPVNGICCDPKQLLRYEDHWIFWFMDDVSRHGWIVQDGILLNDLYDYESAFSLFLLDGKPLFFFQRGDQLGISFNNQEILLPYPHISYDLVCCDGGGRGARNPRGTDRMVGFWVWWGDKEYQYNEYRYIEIGLR